MCAGCRDPTHGALMQRRQPEPQADLARAGLDWQGLSCGAFLLSVPLPPLLLPPFPARSGSSGAAPACARGEGTGCCSAWRGGRKGSTGDGKLLFGRGTRQAPLPVHELQVLLLEAAVLLAVSGRVLLQLRHPLLQKDNLCDGRGEIQPPALKPAGTAAPSAGATSPTSSAACRCSPLASGPPRFVAPIRSRSPRHSSWHHRARQPELQEPSPGLAPQRAT